MLRALVPIGAATPLAPAGQPTTSTGTNDREVEGSTVSADTQAVDLQGVCRPFPPVPYVAYVSASVAGQQTEEQAGMAARPTTAEGLRQAGTQLVLCLLCE